MKVKKIFSTIALLLVVLTSSCSNDPIADSSSNSSAEAKMAADVSAVSSEDNATENQRIGIGLRGVNLGTSGNFVILSKTGITDVYKSTVTGNVGASPITGAAILLRCTEVTGSIYSVNAAGPLPCRITDPSRLTTAVGDMQTAYTDAAGRLNPNYLNLGAGNIGGKTLSPGLYKWTSGVNVPSSITLSGGLNDVWIFQISGNLQVSSGVKIILKGGAQAKNIFWQSTGVVVLGTTSHFEGNILSKTGINMQTGASVNGRLLAQTAVTLQMNTVTKP
jgi:hypothetical protein